MTNDTIKIQVKLAPIITCVTSENEKTFRKKIREYLEELLFDLGIPLEYELEVSTISKMDFPADLFPFTITINQQRSRIRPFIHLEAINSLEELTTRIAHCFYYNREQLLTKKLIVAIQNNWSRFYEQEGIAAMKPETLYLSLRKLVRKGIAINTFIELNADFSKNSKPNQAVDRCHSLSNTQVKILVSKDYYDYLTNLEEEGIFSEKPASEILDMGRKVLYVDLGLFTPDFQLEVSPRLSGSSFRVQINGLRFPPFQGLEKKEFAVETRSTSLQLLGITGKKDTNRYSNGNITIVEQTKDEYGECSESKFTCWTPMDYIIVALFFLIRENTSLLLPTARVTQMLDKLATYRRTLATTFRELFDDYYIANILRKLLDQDVPITNFRKIIDALLSIYSQFEGHFEKLTEEDILGELRSKLKLEICERSAFEERLILTYLLDKSLEEKVNTTTDWTDEYYYRLLRLLENQIGRDIFKVRKLVLLTKAETRESFRKLISKEFPNLIVLSYNEVYQIDRLFTLGKIYWE